MNILHIPNYYFPHIGGIEQTARDIVNSLDNVNQRVFCFSGDKKNTIDEVDGHTIVRCGCIAKVFSQSISLSYGKELKKQFKQFNPDLVIFHYPNPFASHYLLKRLKKYKSCKLVVWWHLDITKQKTLGKLFNGQTERLLKRAQKIVATSPNYLVGSQFLPRYKEKCVIIPSCINEKRLEINEGVIEKSKEIRQANVGKTICFAVGRHVEYKGYEYLIKASSLLDDGFKIYIAGTGILTAELKQMAAGDKKIEFIGRISDEEMKAYMSACDVYCFPSITKNEAFGLALAEAMYFKKPAVTFTINGSGVNYVNLNNVTGIEVENRNVNSYAKALKTLSKDKALREKLGAAAKERADGLFTFKLFKENVNNLIEDL